MSNFKGKNYNYIVMDAVAGAGDLSLVGGVVKFGNPLQVVCEYKNLIPGKCTTTASAAGVARVMTMTFATATNSGNYGVMLQQYNPNTQLTLTRYFYYTADATATVNEIHTGLAAAINADSNIKVSAVGGATLVVTADAGYEMFTMANASEATDTFTLVVTTAGNYAVGTLAALALKGITVTGAAYTTVHMEYNMVMTPSNFVATTEPYILDIYLNEADAQTAALVTAFDNMFAGEAGGVANPEAIAVE